MGDEFARIFGESIRTVEVCKFNPDDPGLPSRWKVDGTELLNLLRQIVEGAAVSECFKDDPETSRWFLIINGESGSHTVEVQPDYAFVGHEWLYTPQMELWRALEKLAGGPSRKPART